jgi:hypothetical protein
MARVQCYTAKPQKRRHAKTSDDGCFFKILRAMLCMGKDDADEYTPVRYRYVEETFGKLNTIYEGETPPQTTCCTNV